MKAIIVATGDATGLYPLTLTVPKHILPVYDKPLVYYPLSVLMLGGIREIMVVASPRDLHGFANLLGDGRQWGLNISYAEQPRPDGAAHAFIVAERFIGNDCCAIIHGDTILYGHALADLTQDAFELERGAYVFAHQVRDPERYSVVDFDRHGRATTIEDRPIRPKSSWAVVGLCVYDNNVVEIAKQSRAPARGELGLSNLNAAYLQRGELKVGKLGRGFAWFDTGTPDALLEAANYVAALEKQQGLKVASPEEIAVRLGYISPDGLERLISDRYANNDYGRYLKSVLAEF